MVVNGNILGGIKGDERKVGVDGFYFIGYGFWLTCVWEEAIFDIKNMNVLIG